MKFISDDILVLVIEENGEPIAVIQKDSHESKDGVTVRALYNNELARENIQEYLDKYPIKK